MINENTEKWIDEADYETLLRKWRFAPVGHPLLQGETGDYFAKSMFGKKDNCDHVAISKRVGWGW